MTWLFIGIMVVVFMPSVAFLVSRKAAEKKKEAGMLFNCPFLHWNGGKSSCVSPVTGYVVPFCTQYSLPGGYARQFADCTAYKLYIAQSMGASTADAMHTAGVTTFGSVVTVGANTKPNQASDSTSEPAPGADSSAHQG
jgi:hypothetical protein